MPLLATCRGYLTSDRFLHRTNLQQAENSNHGSSGGWERLDEELQLEGRLPQLIICGHGSVDDPDGTWVRDEWAI
jgi:hypothetical protein